MRTTLSFILFTFLIFDGHNQASPSYEHYFLNGFLVNPAMSGSNYYPVINLNAKKQWIQVNGSPGTQLFSANFRLGRYDFYGPKMLLNKSRYKNNERIGLGISLYNDNNGPLSDAGILLSYAYHVPVNFNQLAFGLSFSFRQYKLNENEFDPIQEGDPNINGGIERFYFPNAGMGMFYYGDLFYIGGSVNDMFRINNGFTSAENSNVDFFINSGYKIWMGKNFAIEPSVMFKKIDGDPFSFDFSSQLYIASYNWIALTYRTTNSMQFMMGFRISPYVSIGYAYEYYISGTATAYNGSHMIVLGRNIGLRNVSGIRKVTR